MSEKIGIGIVTYNRPEYLYNLLESLNKCNLSNSCLVVVNDGTPYENFASPISINTIQNERNLGVAKSKNKALNFLLKNECEYYFLIEDDMLIKDASVFDQYIAAYKESGIHHFNYGPGSPFNRKQKIANFDLHNRHLLDSATDPNPKLIVEYKTCKIALYEHIVGMFSFFTKKLVENNLGYMCEDFDNCWEHVSSTNYIIKAGYHPPFWWFADLANSHELIEEAPGAIQNSVIAKNTEDWTRRVMEGREIYKNKHGYYPNQPPSYTESQVLEILKQIKKSK